MDIEPLSLTDFHPTEMRASNNVHRGTIPSHGKVEGDDEPPVFDQRWNPIDQTSEKRQEGEFDGHHGHPSQYQVCRDQLPELEDSVEVLRSEREASWRICHCFGEVRIIHIDIEDCHGSDQAGGAERQDGIVNREFFLNCDSNVVPSTYTEKTDSEKESRRHL